MVSFRTLLVSVSALACFAPSDSEWMAIGPQEGEPTLVVVFRDDASPQEVFRVVTGGLGRIVDPGTGSSDLLPGMRSTVKIDVHGHTAYVVSFRTNSTLEQREFVRSRVVDEPSVLALFENMDPSEIRSDQLL